MQPSRFEGWNTSIEDAKAIGRPVIASGIDVHREQVADAFGFFDVDDPAGLADLLAHAEVLPAGPDLDGERVALADARRSLVEIGRTLYSICEEAVAVATAARRQIAVRWSSVLDLMSSCQPVSVSIRVGLIAFRRVANTGNVERRKGADELGVDPLDLLARRGQRFRKGGLDRTVQAPPYGGTDFIRRHLVGAEHDRPTDGLGLRRDLATTRHGVDGDCGSPGHEREHEAVQACREHDVEASQHADELRRARGRGSVSDVDRVERDCKDLLA